MSVDYERRGRVAVVTIDRADVRNAIDRATARALGDAWRTFDTDPRVDVGVLYGAGGNFSAGADLKTFDLVDDPAGFLGFTRLEVGKPTIAAVEGYCVAGGMEMALWCDLRVASTSAVFGFFERRFGVPLVDGGTVRLPRLVGTGLALELILTGREVTADEALVIGLANTLVPEGSALDRSVALAEAIATHPQETVRSDRMAMLGGLGLPTAEALELERRLGNAVMDVAAAGADRFAAGAGRSGTAVPAVFATPKQVDIAIEETPEPSGAPLPPDDPALTPPPGGHGRPVIVVASPAEESWRGGVEGRLRDLGFVTYSVRVDGALDEDLGRVGAAVKTLMGSPAVLGDRVGLVALGAGAVAALHYSTMDGRISSVVEFSGRAPETQPSFRLAAAAYLGHHGSAEDDPASITPLQMESHLRDLGMDATFHTYRSGSPTFFVSGADGYNEAFAEVAWQRTRLFLDRTI